MTTQETLKLALKALKEGDWYIGQLETIVYSSDDNGTHGNRAKVQEAIKALEEALAKQEKKKNKWEDFDLSIHSRLSDSNK